MLNRKSAPPIKNIGKLSFPQPVCHYLDNDTPVYVLNMGTQDIVKLEIIFHAGRPYEQKCLAGRVAGSLLKDGTTTMSGQQFAEKIDFYGGTLHVPANLDHTEISLFCLSKHFLSLVPYVADMVKNPAYHQEELGNFKQRSKERLKVDLSKTDVVAYRDITEAIFGAVHPYGYNSTAEMYDTITRADLVSHHQRCFTPANCSIFLSGNFDSDSFVKALNKHLGQHQRGCKAELKMPGELRETSGKRYILKPDAVQTSIRIGRRLFSRNHPDYNAFQVLNTILGGYFGSRLMGNIREEKGYTYNIFSTVDTMLFDGYFYIGTEVGNNFVKATIKEIYGELDRLKSDLVEDAELEMVRNYLMGNLLTMLDGPMNVSGVTKTMILEKMTLPDFDDLVRTIKNVTPEELRLLARKYFVENDLWELIVGKIE